MPAHVRMSRAQFALFGSPDTQDAKPKGGKGGTKKPREKKRKEDLPENILEDQVRSFMVSRGWVATRNHVGRFVPLYVVMQAIENKKLPVMAEMGGRIVTIGTKGQCDWTFSRPRPELGFGVHQRIHVELKADGKKPSPDQVVWMRERNAMHEPAEWFDSFEDDWKRPSFVTWYKRHFGEVL